VDTTGWNGISNTIPITSAQVDQLAAFVNALPSGWQVIYGINFIHNTADNVEAEAVYAQSKLGSRLYGFEIGNEPEYYPAPDNTISGFDARYRILAAAITNHVPGWAITHGGNGWVLVGADAGQGQYVALTDPFANDESGKVSLITQHYYRLGGGSSSCTMQNVLAADSSLPTLAANIASAAYSGSEPLGARISESGSTSAGGTLQVSDVYGAALWSLDEMFTAALNSVQGVNFHGGGKSPYSPITDNGTVITSVGPEFYGMGMFAMIPPGDAVAATISPTPSINFTAYGVNCASGGKAALLNNKEVNDTVNATVTLGSSVASVAEITLTSPSLFTTNNGVTLGGSAIGIDGTWTGGVQSVLSVPSGSVTVGVPPISAVLLVPITVGSKPATVTSGPNWNLREDLTTGSADFVYHYASSTDTNFVMGDWDGDGTTGPGVVRINSSGQWEWILRNSNNGGGGNYDFTFGTAIPGDILIVGDWDGDGKWTPGIVRTNSVGQWQWLLTNTNLVSGNAGTNYNFAYGGALPGDVLVTGDWDNGGYMTPGIVRTNSSSQWEWLLRTSNSGGGANYDFVYGGFVSGDVPIVGDWDGNGTYTPGIIRGTNWLLRNSNNGGGADISFDYGSTGDKFLIWH
jgi:hypothetical protein